jgi:hypothetical protein
VAIVVIVPPLPLNQDRPARLALLISKANTTSRLDPDSKSTTLDDEVRSLEVRSVPLQGHKGEVISAGGARKIMILRMKSCLPMISHTLSMRVSTSMARLST